MILYIKNMVSLRCKLRVKAELEQLGLRYQSIDMGTVQLVEPIGPADQLLLAQRLQTAGLELTEDKKVILIEKIKTAVISSIRNNLNPGNVNFSNALSHALDYEYNYLSNNFSRVMGITIGQYVISQKIEMAKEYLLYDELNLSEIARMLHYSSVGHLSRQFKEVTGLTPSYFKQSKAYHLRIALEDL